MGSDVEYLHSEVLELLDYVEIDPESVAQRALILLNVATTEPATEVEVLALVMRCYGLAVRGCGRINEALVWLEKSVDVALAGGLISIAASSQLTLASTISMTGDFGAALQHTEIALPFLPVNEIAAALSRRAIFLQRLERTNEAVIAYNEAVDRAQSDEEALVLAKVLNNRGLFRVELGEMTQAASDLLASSKKFLDLGLVAVSASMDHNLGWCFARQGLVVEALNAYDRSDAKGGLGNSATWEGAFDRAEVYVSGRLLHEALHSANHSLRLAREVGFESEVPVISLQLGRIHGALEDVVSAQECFSIAAARFHDQGRHVSAAAAEMCRLLIDKESLSKPGARAAASLSGEDPHGYRDTVVDVAFGELLRVRLRSKPASNEKMVLLKNILESGLASANSLTRLQAYAARIVFLGHREASEDGFRTVLVDAAEKLFHELEHHLEGIHSQELRTVVVDKLELEALFCLAALSIGDSTIFRLWISRLRSAVTTPTQLVQPAQPTLSTEPNLPNLSTEPTRATSSDEPSIQHRNAIEPVDPKRLRQSSKGPQRSALEFAVRTTNWISKAEDLIVTNPSALRHFLVPPGKGQVRLVYAQNAANVVVSVITEDAETVEILGTLKEIRTRSESVHLGAAALFGSNAIGGDGSEQRAASVMRAIDRLESLVLPSSLPPGDLLISTTGALGAVPWNLFSRLAKRAVVLTSSMSPLLDTTSFTDHKGAHPMRVAIVEGPNLEYASREVDAVAALYGDTIVLRGSQATMDATADLLTSVDLIHIAAHGHRRVDNALFSGIELFDGPLMAYDIERLSKTPKTVVLSCCDLGAANSQGAFGLLGFSGALVSRGSRQVGAALLPVSDEMSRPVMVRLHTAMIGGLSIAQAVSQGVESANTHIERVTAGSYVVKGP
jgi:tetratricopeptide (TPR) repeat protein